MKARLSFALLLALTHLGLGYTKSGNVFTTNGSANDVQAALNAAPGGATVKIPAGKFTWSSYVTASHGVRLEGAGPDRTTVETVTPQAYHNVLTLISDANPALLTGIAFTNQYNVGVSTNTNSATFRVWNCSFDNGTTQSVFLSPGGNGKGLIDHCTFSGGGASEMIHNMGLGASNKDGWRDDVHPGTDEAVYVENCTFSKNPLEDAYHWGTASLQAYYGARTVIRHTRNNASHMDQHGTPGAVGARWFEIYDNSFYVPPPSGDYDGMAMSDYIALRGGSGVVFNNRVSGHNLWGNGNITVYDENGGSEPLYLGRGIDQNPSPFYVWHNFQYDGSPMRVVSTSANVIENRDYFVSDSQPDRMKRWQQKSDNANTTYTYTAFRYPHPLDDLPTDQYGPVVGEQPQPTPTPTPQPTATPPQPTPTPAQKYRLTIESDSPITVIESNH